jgi:hypothetical protein
MNGKTGKRRDVLYLVRYVNLCLITENKFVLEKVPVGRIFLQVFQLSPVRVIEPALNNHSSITCAT